MWANMPCGGTGFFTPPPPPPPRLSVLIQVCAKAKNLKRCLKILMATLFFSIAVLSNLLQDTWDGTPNPDLPGSNIAFVL